MHVVPKFEGDYFFLSNFYEAPTTFDLQGEPVVFATGEAAFQAAKMHAMEKNEAERLNYVREVANAPKPGKAKYVGRSAKIDLELWESIKVKAMREVVFQKFYQHPDLRVKLLETGHAMLVEGNDWGDTFWGRCEGKGKNILGVILMETRGYWHWTAEANRRSFARDMD